MNRRAFLGFVGVGVAGLAFDPERLLWRPGAKTIFLPSEPQILASGWADGLPLKVGDTFTIQGFYAVNPPTLEVMRVTAVNGATITVDRGFNTYANSGLKGSFDQRTVELHSLKSLKSTHA